MKMTQRILIINEQGRQHQSWDLENEGKGFVLTYDVNIDAVVSPLWGIYTIRDYRNKIKDNDFIQKNI